MLTAKSREWVLLSVTDMIYLVIIYISIIMYIFVYMYTLAYRTKLIPFK